MNLYPDKQGRTAEEAAEYWREAYFDLIFKRGSYVNWLKQLNESLRLQLHNRSVEIQRYADGYHRVGETWYAPTVCKSLEDSRYLRYPYE